MYAICGLLAFYAVVYGLPLWLCTRLGKPNHLIRCKFCLQRFRKHQVCWSERNVARKCEAEL